MFPISTSRFTPGDSILKVSQICIEIEFRDLKAYEMISIIVFNDEFNPPHLYHYVHYSPVTVKLI